MAYQKMQRFETDMSIGLNNFIKDMSPILQLSKNSYNTSTGINMGHAPRYGMSPIPGHSTSDYLDPTNSVAGGLMASEATDSGSGPDYDKRIKVFAILPVTIPTYDDLTVTQTSYVWVIGFSSGSFVRINLIHAGADLTLYNFCKYQGDIADGFGKKPYVNDTVSFEPYRWHTSDYPATISFVEQKAKNTLNHMSCATISVSGQQRPMINMVGEIVGSAPDSTHSASPNFVQTFSSGNSGVPSSFNLVNFSVTPRSIKAYDESLSRLTRTYVYNNFTGSGPYLPVFNLNTSLKSIDFSGITSSEIVPTNGPLPAYSDAKNVLVIDPLNTIDSSYTMVMAAIASPTANAPVSSSSFPGTFAPLVAIIQPWLRSGNAVSLQYVNLVHPRYLPKTVATTNQGSGSYTEDTIAKQTCWVNWPSFVTGTPLQTDAVASYDGTANVALGAAGSGLLRANTVYEITFSVFDKQTNHESNVGVPAKIQTGSADFVALSLIRDSQTGAVFNQTVPTSAAGIPISSTGPSGGNFSNSTILPWNYVEFRFYYRPLGSFQWLPTLFIDAAKFFFYPDFQVLWICQSPIAGLPGGQPGDFNDYSPLQDDKWDDVKVFQNRVFWSSSKQAVFSLRNEPFSYPLRNSLPAPTGEFRGMTVHVFPGQSEQTGRILFWGTEQAYTGRFTGQPQDTAIQIDPNTLGAFPLDGSDFTVEAKTSFTAFSHRAAVVCEGVLYYWGPQGIFEDGGVNIPNRISLNLHPDIYNLYDPNLTDDIFAVYNDDAYEVIWFYTAKNEPNGFTSAIIYNRINQQFYNYKFNGKIDWAQRLTIDKAAVSRGTNGTRTVIGVRKNASTVLQRACYFDPRNRAGDWFPTTEFMVQTVGALASSQIVLTLGGGFDATNLTSVIAGDTVTLHQAADYSGQSTATDFIGTVVSRNVGAGTITISVPSSIVSYYAGTLTADKYIPIWISRINAFNFVLETNVWTPGGLKFWGLWLFAHLIFKTKLLPSVSPQTVTLNYQTPISGGYLSNILTLTQPPIGDMQVYTQLRNTNQGFEGQGLQVNISGSQNGANWVLQYLGLDATMVEGDQLMMFQG